MAWISSINLVPMARARFYLAEMKHYVLKRGSPKGFRGTRERGRFQLGDRGTKRTIKNVLEITGNKCSSPKGRTKKKKKTKDVKSLIVSCNISFAPILSKSFFFHTHIVNIFFFQPVCMELRKSLNWVFV